LLKTLLFHYCLMELTPWKNVHSSTIDLLIW
jgi:hypothetical protein